MKADLHMHTTYSDGRLSNEEVFKLAKENKVDIISITDHDVVGGVIDNIRYAKEYGVKYIVGMELSTVHLEKSVHILGYFTDESYKSETLKNYTKNMIQKREVRAKKMIALLKEHFNIEIDYDEIFKEAYGIIARPHIAKAINNKYPQYSHDYIFTHFIGDNSKAYVPSSKMSVQEGLDFLKELNCVGVLAHPVLLKKHIKEFVLSHEFDGVEANYFRNKEGDEQFYRDYAKKNDIIITAGSDFHGIKGDTKHGVIGTCTITGEDLQIFLEKVGQVYE